MHSRIHSHIGELMGFGVSALGVLTANQEQVEYWLRCTASCVAIASGALAIWSIFRKKPTA